MVWPHRVGTMYMHLLSTREVLLKPAPGSVLIICSSGEEAALPCTPARVDPGGVHWMGPYTSLMLYHWPSMGYIYYMYF